MTTTIEDLIQSLAKQRNEREAAIIQKVLTCSKCGAFNQFVEIGRAYYSQSITIDLGSLQMAWGSYEIDGDDDVFGYDCGNCGDRISKDQEDDIQSLQWIDQPSMTTSWDSLSVDETDETGYE